MSQRGRLIVFEGIDGSGKSTQAKRLADKMSRKGLPCITTREPSDRPIGRLIRQYLSGEYHTDNKALAALFAADRLDHILCGELGLMQALEKGIHIICDRYYLSSYAYHGAYMPVEWVKAVNQMANSILVPDIQIYIDLPPEDALHRVKDNRHQAELYENESSLRKVYGIYKELIEKADENENIVVVDGKKVEEMLAIDIWNHVSPFFNK